MEEFNIKKDWDEGLNPFFSSLSAFDQKTWYADEVYRRKKMGIVTLADHSLEVIRSAKRKCKTKEVTGIHNYEILSNHDYAQLFGYTSIEMRQNEIEEIMSDQVANIIYLGEQDQSRCEIGDMENKMKQFLTTEMQKHSEVQ